MIQEHSITEPKRFKPFGKWEIDSRTYIRKFSGKMTKGRWKVIDRYVRSLNWRTRCHHEWDCCGCHFENSAKWDYKQNQVRIYLTENYNY